MIIFFNTYKIEMIITSLIVSAILLVFSSCNSDDLEIKNDFPFEVNLMPVPTEISNGQTVEIRMKITSEGNYQNTKYYIRYFQFEGVGDLRYFDNPPFLPNDLYELASEEFRLYYTSLSDESTEFSIWISDNFGNERKLDFQFNNVD